MTVRAWLERQATAAWYGGARWAHVLRPLSLLVGWVTGRRRQRYLSHPPAPLSRPVVVVGSVTVGGTGKSPVLVALAKGMAARGVRAGIVSRGYGGRETKVPRLVDPDQDDALAVGDEPLMIARQTGCPVVVGRERAAAAQWLLRHQPVDVVLSDDGLQHYAMPREVEIVVLDRARMFGNGWLLPAGPLREPLARLQTVDRVLIRNGDEPDSAFRYRLSALRHPASRAVRTPEDQAELWRDRSIIAITGLGQPGQFFDFVRTTGLSIEPHALADHEAIDSDTLSALEADIILTTAKDEVKLAAPVDPRVWVVDIEAELPADLVDDIIGRAGV